MYNCVSNDHLISGSQCQGRLCRQSSEFPELSLDDSSRSSSALSCLRSSCVGYIQLPSRPCLSLHMHHTLTPCAACCAATSNLTIGPAKLLNWQDRMPSRLCLSCAWAHTQTQGHIHKHNGKSAACPGILHVQTHTLPKQQRVLLRKQSSRPNRQDSKAQLHDDDDAA